MKHTDTCRARFAELVRADEEEAAARRAALRALGENPETPAPGVAPETPAPNVAPGTPGPPPGVEVPEEIGRDADAVRIVSSGAALPPCTATATNLTVSTHARESLPVFGLAAPSTPRVGGDGTKPHSKHNKRTRRKGKPVKLTTVFEYACSHCSPDSMLGRVHEELGVPHVRLAKETLDVENEIVALQLHEQLRACPRSHLWASLPCTSGCQWHRVQLKKGGFEYRARLMQKVQRSRQLRQLFKQFTEHAKTALEAGIEVTFEWPRYSDSWKRPDVKEFFKDPRFKVVDFDGCRLGVSVPGGQPVKKPWRLMTTSNAVVSAFEGLRCNHEPSEHVEARGKDLEHTGLYTQEMCERIAFAINPSRAYISVPAMPVIPATTQQQHREREQELKHVSALSGYEDLAAVVESDEEASKLVEEVVDLNALMCMVHGIPKSAPTREVSAMVTKLLSRAEMLSSPEALEAIRQEAAGLRSVPVWDEENPREFADVQAQARRTGTKVHFGKLMSIASIRFWELAKHLPKVKGRIVYRGDCAKDEEGAAAVYRELGANPTSVQGLNACLACGSLPGNQSSAADAIKAYVQALLKSKYQTWIELPPELRPAWRRECFARPVVLLLRALYGHPEAGGLWEKHLKEVLKGMGGKELPEYPGNFWFPETRLLLSTYVDDLTLSGPQEEHQPFWETLCKVVDVEPPGPVYRILGRNHCIINAAAEGTENAALGALKGAMAFDMLDYAQQTVDLYKSLTGLKGLKHAATPFAPESSLPPSQEEVSGELAPNACKVLMKALWLGRLARPDLVKPIGDLATKVQKWSRNDDKKLLRLISYIDSTKTHRLVGTVSDGPRELHLALYVDADFAGERDDAKSTSGGYLVLKGPNTFFPLAWVSKRQTSVSRSTTESEIVSLAHSLFQEALPALQLWQTILDYPIELVIHEDNQATILVAKKGYSPKLRHIARTHKVNLGSIAEVLDADDVKLQYVETTRSSNTDDSSDLSGPSPTQRWLDRPQSSPMIVEVDENNPEQTTASPSQRVLDDDDLWNVADAEVREARQADADVYDPWAEADEVLNQDIPESSRPASAPTSVVHVKAMPKQPKQPPIMLNLDPPGNQSFTVTVSPDVFLNPDIPHRVAMAQPMTTPVSTSIPATISSRPSSSNSPNALALREPFNIDGFRLTWPAEQFRSNKGPTALDDVRRSEPEASGSAISQRF